MIPNGGKILVFTDLHFGIHSNSSSYSDICSDTMKWIGDVSKSESVQNIMFMGDFFDSRASIDVKTLNIATESLYKLTDCGFSVTMILGNHDIYLRDSTSIHSLFAFSGHKGITVVDKPVSENGVVLLPWQYGTADGNHIELHGDERIVFCHHDFPREFFLGMNGTATRRRKASDTHDGGEYSEFGFQEGLVSTVVKNGGVIFSGHIHNRMEIPLGDGKSKIVIEGSPYETSWGFGGVECGAYVVDLDECSYRFIPNPSNRKHVEIRTSSFEKDFGSFDIGNSIVRLNVDTQEHFNTISEMQQRIRQKNPFLVENTKYEFTAAEFSGDGKSEKTDNAESHSICSKLDYINSAIDNADFSSFSYMKDGKSVVVDRKRIKDIAAIIYEGGKIR